MNPARPLVRLENLAVGYGQHVVLAGLDLALASGSFTALLGANGSGKSTLLKALAGILKPLAGQIRWAAPEARPVRLGYVPQRETLDSLFLLSGFEVALMGTFNRLRPGRIVRATERARVGECLRLTGAEGFAGRPFAQLSGGQKQRILIARALAVQPDLLLLDEPVAGVDPAHAQAIMDLLVRLHGDQGLSVILVTHDLPTVRRHIPEVLWLQGGRAVHGPASELLTPARIEDLLELSWS
ncbi:MAG: metal ABC transporter ATP-binding protein [Verrucomicrobia bacterium]|nr:metal ABC transporter ATP-binding protein [Verrucomicrobiota bacterium]